MDFSKVRKWQVYFSVNRPFESLPQAGELVEELETSPDYRLDGYSRNIGGGQISLTIGGRGAIKTGNRVFELVPGQAFLHNHDDPDVSYYYPPSSSEPWRFIWVSFQNGGIEKTISEINRRYGYVFTPGMNSPLLHRMMSYRPLAGTVLQLTPLESSSLVHELLKLLCENQESAERRNPHHRLVGELRNWIAANPEGDLRTDTLARRFGMSREHLSRIFRRQSGITLQSYIADFRLHLAGDLLRQTRLSGKEICDRCGYRTYSAFCRAFIKYCGETPQRLRKRRDS